MFKNVFFTIANLAPRDLTLQTGYPHNNGQGSGLGGVSCMEGQPYLWWQAKMAQGSWENGLNKSTKGTKSTLE
jgi:hypothetical protein